MSWREAVLNAVGPGAFAGITLGDWFRVLRENRFAVDPRYWPRAAAITFASLPNSLFRWLENLRFGRLIRETNIDPPVFILGTWRSGTTHLHNLLTRDDRFAYANFYQVVYPHTFLSTEKASAKVMALFLPPKRPQDNMKFGVQEPQEEEFALCVLTGHSVMMGLAFPRNTAFYDHFLTLRELSEREQVAWECALRWFLQKLTFKYRRPLVLKSPGHTCRIKLLLALFPNAKFVHIHRNPYAVFQSTIHAVRALSPGWALQQTDYRDLIEHTIGQYKTVYDRFFEERHLIPKGQFHEDRKSVV